MTKIMESSQEMFEDARYEQMEECEQGFRWAAKKHARVKRAIISKTPFLQPPNFDTEEFKASRMEMERLSHYVEIDFAFTAIQQMNIYLPSICKSVQPICKNCHKHFQITSNEDFDVWCAFCETFLCIPCQNICNIYSEVGIHRCWTCELPVCLRRGYEGTTCCSNSPLCGCCE